MTEHEITFRKLEIFLCYMEKRNIARTAEVLNLSTVSIHRALHTLEENIQCPLFAHQGRYLVPLPAAFTLIEYARNLTELMKLALNATRASAGFNQNHIILGTLYSLTIETIPNLLMGLKLRNAEIKMDMIMGSNEELLLKLEKQHITAALISLSNSKINTQIYQTLPLFDDQIFLGAPLDSPISMTTPVNLSTLTNEKFVSLAEGFATFSGFKEIFQVAHFEPDVVTRVNDIFSLVNLVQGGVGYTLLPGRVKKMYGNTIKMIPLAKPYQMKQSIGLVFPYNREYDPALLALVAESRMYSRKLKQQLS